MSLDEIEKLIRPPIPKEGERLVTRVYTKEMDGNKTWHYCDGKLYAMTDVMTTYLHED